MARSNRRKLKTQTDGNITRIREGFAAIERGEYTDYFGREGLRKLAASVKEPGRRKLARTPSGR
jgi:hypothetical protein